MLKSPLKSTLWMIAFGLLIQIQPALSQTGSTAQNGNNGASVCPDCQVTGQRAWGPYAARPVNEEILAEPEVVRMRGPLAEAFGDIIQLFSSPESQDLIAKAENLGPGEWTLTDGPTRESANDFIFQFADVLEIPDGSLGEYRPSEGTLHYDPNLDIQPVLHLGWYDGGRGEDEPLLDWKVEQGVLLVNRWFETRVHGPMLLNQDRYYAVNFSLNDGKVWVPGGDMIFESVADFESWLQSEARGR